MVVQKKSKRGKKSSTARSVRKTARNVPRATGSNQSKNRSNLLLALPEDEGSVPSQVNAFVLNILQHIYPPPLNPMRSTALNDTDYHFSEPLLAGIAGLFDHKAQTAPGWNGAYVEPDDVAALLHIDKETVGDVVDYLCAAIPPSPAEIAAKQELLSHGGNKP